MTLAVLPATATTAGGAKVFNQTSILATDVIAVGHQTSPYLTAYPWTAGFGSKYSDPASLPTGIAYGVNFAPNGSAVGLATQSSSSSTSYITVYSWASGFGTRYGVNGTAVGRSSAFSPNSQDIALTSTQSGIYVRVWPWSGSGLGAAYSNPGTAPTGGGYGVAWKPDGADLIVAHATSPYVSAYPWSAGFGTKYSDPGIALTVTGQSVAFTPTGSDVAVGGGTGPNVYPWSAGFGTRYSNPASTITSVSVAFSKLGTTIAASTTASPYLHAYAWSGSGFGTKYTDPATAVGGAPQATSSSPNVAFAVNDSAIAVVHATSPYISAYPWNTTTGFGTKYTDPGSAIAGTGQSVAFRTMFT